MRIILVLFLLLNLFLKAECPDFACVEMDARGNVWVASEISLSPGQTAIQLAYQPFGLELQTPFTISDTSFSSESPLLSINESGDAVASWLTHDTKNSVDAIYIATLQSGKSWSTPIRLSKVSESCFYPKTSTVMTDNGNGALFWVAYDMINGCLALYVTHLNVSQDSPRTFRLSEIDENVSKDYTLQYTSDGRIVIAWNSYIFKDQTTVLNILSGDMSGNWYPKTRITLK